jgi:hypothetical protein
MQCGNLPINQSINDNDTPIYILEAANTAKAKSETRSFHVQPKPMNYRTAWILPWGIVLLAVEFRRIFLWISDRAGLVFGGVVGI